MVSQLINRGVIPADQQPQPTFVTRYGGSRSFLPRLVDDDPAAESGTSVRLLLGAAAPEWGMAPRHGGPPADRLPASAMAGRS